MMAVQNGNDGKKSAENNNKTHARNLSLVPSTMHKKSEMVASDDESISSAFWSFI